ncbi:TPA_asm: immunity repressor [Mycobacterium phage McProf]|uniref:hypothetical protein n=1 Tax=Mycobacteroides chelonae TaxID=1774 RepID=UPI000618C7D8|nr:hypothetical protein [Mycobacteroides chelonae]VEG15677.1 Uncharacterised protein [Mycolicibacterium phlei]DAZ89991.1 TPA_asm: immunity repressor [Mycobacterium phage McProf]AKC38406.1 hypothetical protein GR01_07200 [Mycobacteroides chelonae]ANB00826.1 hypothetical protein BB28_07655 [Mycobacteroides chelonae CCUG 47445]OLT75244.1 hypothetical protein BKG56_15930 [Mycobacteroides chelonae]
MPITNASSDEDGLTLQDLILTLKGDRTYKDLEDASGGVVKAQRWNQITNGIKVKEFPEPASIEGMARALNVKLDVILLSIARSVGLPVEEDVSRLAAMLPPGAEKLGDAQLGLMLSLLREMIKASENDGDRDTESAPKVLGSKTKPEPGAPKKTNRQTRTNTPK